MDVYTLKKKKNTGELHLFKGVMQPDNRCTTYKQSICKQMEKSEIEGKNAFACATEVVARMKAAKIGRNVCGICVSHLYGNY